MARRQGSSTERHGSRRPSNVWLTPRRFRIGWSWRTHGHLETGSSHARLARLSRHPRADPPAAVVVLSADRGGRARADSRERWRDRRREPPQLAGRRDADHRDRAPRDHGARQRAALSPPADRPAPAPDGAVPVHRRAEAGDDPRKNEEMFAAAIEALCAGGVILIFPEGRTQPQPILLP